MTHMEQVDKFAAWTDAEILEEIHRRLKVWTDSLKDVAEIVVAAVRRGIDLSEVLSPGVISDLRKIESGQILPELVENYIHTDVYPRLKGLPIDDQKMIVKTKKVGVVVRRGDSFDYRKMPVAALTGDQMRLALGRGRINSQEEQIAILESEEIEEPDAFDEATVVVRIPACDVEMTKTQKKKLMKLKEREGNLPALVQRAIMKMVD